MMEMSTRNIMAQFRGGNIEIPSLYALKSICLIFVVAIHTCTKSARWLMPLLQVAVPVFYVITGYFLYVKIRNNNSEYAAVVVRKMLKKVCFLTLWSNGFYFLFHCLWRLQLEPLTWRNLADVFITGTSASYHLWYLTALGQALLLFYLLFRFRPQCVHLLVVCFVFFFAGGVLLSSYYGLLFAAEPSLQASLNAVFGALPCLSAGMLLGKVETRVRKYRVVHVMPIILFCALATEVSIIAYAGMASTPRYYMLTLPMALSLVLWCLIFPSMSFPSVYSIGKFHSGMVYVVHVAFGITYTYIAAKLQFPLPEFAVFLLALFSSLIFSAIIQNVSLRYINKKRS